MHMECFETIIGLVPDGDTCIDGYEEDYSTSKSGMHLSTLKGISMSNACGMDVWAMMIQARQGAVRTVKTDLFQEAGRYFQPVRNAFTGDIGALQFARTQTTGGFYGMRVFTNVEGARIRFVGVTLMPFASGDFDVLIYDDHGLLRTEQVTGAIARRPRRLIFDVPLVVEQGSVYFIVQGGEAYTGKMFCCGAKGWCFNIDNPCYNTTRRNWSSWAMAAGIQGSDIGDRDSWATYSRNYGLVLHASFSCNMDNVLCSDYSDFVHNENDRALAWAILYKTGEMFLNAAIDSGEVNRYTLLAGEALDFRREEYLKGYEQMIKWLAANMDTSRNDCFVCRPVSKITNRFL